MKPSSKDYVTGPECEATHARTQSALYLIGDAAIFTACIIRSGLVVLLLCFIPALRAPAQEDTVTINAAEFQRLVYSAHLQTQFAEKPELDACLQVQLELHRRSPSVDPHALADLSRQALQRYRAEAPAHLRSTRFRDEILAAYLEAMRQVPARTNWVSADLQLLNGFMLQPEDYTKASPAELMHSGNQRLLASARQPVKRQNLADACIRRAHANASFAIALDSLLVPEAPVRLHDSPAAIIGNPNSALHDNVTMQTLLALSAASGNGSLTVSSNEVKLLFEQEMNVLWRNIYTNRALALEFNESEPDWLAYLTNQPARDFWEARIAAARETRTIASSTAAILVQSQLAAAPDATFQVPDWVGPAADTLGGLARLFISGDPGALISSLGGLIELFDTSESPDEQIIREIGNIQTLLGDLSTNMNYRFDRVDQSLTLIFQKLNEEFSKIEITLDAQGRQIARLNGNVDQIRASLVEMQTDLHRLERHLLAYVTQLHTRGLNQDFNYYLGYEATYGLPMTYASFGVPEGRFFTHARNNSVDVLSAPYRDRDYTPQGLFTELTESGGGATNRLDQNLSYIKKYLDDVLGQPTAGALGELANPRDWFVGAYSYAQLALENPRYFRQVNPSRLDLIMARGHDLTNFFRSLTFSGQSVNLPLHTALKSHYASNLISFNGQVSGVEATYATEHAFDVGTWRRWHAAAPRVTGKATQVVSVSEVWGEEGVTIVEAIVPGLTNAVAIAAGASHDLALKADGTVVSWGDNSFGQTNVPSGLSKVVAIAAGRHFSLAVKADGSVVGWGNNESGQITIPANATNVMTVAAGRDFSLAVKLDGTIVSWGNNDSGQITIPAGATNVVAVAAGWDSGLALKADGSVVGWGAGYIAGSATSGIVAVAPSWNQSVALKADGSVIVWGDPLFTRQIPASATNVVAISAYQGHHLALRADGSVVFWGRIGELGDIPIPASATNVVAIASGGEHVLFLELNDPQSAADDGNLSFIRAQLPARLGGLFQGCNQNTLEEMDRVGPLSSAALGLSGPKALLTAVLELALPYTLERDEVLHGFLYGSEPLVDLDLSRGFLQAQNAALQASPNAPFRTLTDVAVLRYQCFAERLTACLNDLQASGQPEIPRLIGHTLQLLNLLRDAWTESANVPPPALELWSEAGSPRLLLFGEPYTSYALHYRDNLGLPGWNATSITNWRSEQIITPPISDSPQRFYRSLVHTQ